MYGIIIALFILAGVGVTLWGWWLVIRARERRSWPRVDGVIETSRVPKGDLFPQISFRYTVNGTHFQGEFDYPAGAAPSPDAAEKYVRQFPVGARADVYYNPSNPKISILLSDSGKDNWLMVVIGVVSALFGTGLLLFHG